MRHVGTQGVRRSQREPRRTPLRYTIGVAKNISFEPCALRKTARQATPFDCGRREAPCLLPVTSGTG